MSRSPDWWSLDGAATRTCSAHTPRKGSTSTSTRTRRLEDDCASAVYELATVCPHLGRTPRFTAETWAVYCDGYYTALGAAHAAVRGAADRHKTRERIKRAEAAERRAEDRRLREAVSDDRGEHVGMSSQKIPDAAVQRRQGGRRKHVTVSLLAYGVDERELESPGVDVALQVDLNRVGTDHRRHAEHDTAELAGAQLEIQRDRICD